MSQNNLMDEWISGIEGSGEKESRVNMALAAPGRLTAAEIGERDRLAGQKGMSYGMADAGWESLRREMTAERVKKNPAAEKWTEDAPENVAFLDEDGDKLLEVYQTLKEQGILNEEDAPDRETMEDIARSGSGLDRALRRGRLNNERTDLWQKYLSGEMTADDARAENERLTQALRELDTPDPLGFYGAVEQVYRMGTRDLPEIAATAAQWGLSGAIAGGTAGSVVPFFGNAAGAAGGALAGFGAGLGAGALGGSYKSAQQLEAADFGLSMLMEKDEQGKYLDEEGVREYSALYGALAGLVEVAGNAAGAKIAGLVPGLRGVAQSLKLWPKKQAQQAVKTVLRDRAGRAALLRLARGMGAGALSEGLEEGTQQALSEQIEGMLKKAASDSGRNFYSEGAAGGLFSADAAGNIFSASVEGAKMGVWFHVLPAAVHAAKEYGAAARAAEYADANKKLAEKIGESKTKEISPRRLQTYLQTIGLTGQAVIPCDALWQLEQQGHNISGSLGWNADDLQRAAELGQEYEVSVAELQAALPTDTMKAVADYMREMPDAQNFREAGEINENLPADLDAEIESAELFREEQADIDFNMERLHDQMTAAVKASGRLRGQIESGADADSTVENYVRAQLDLMYRQALYINRATSGRVSVGGYLGRVEISGPVTGPDGRIYDSWEQMEEAAAAEAEDAASDAFWEVIWGRLDYQSLKTDFPDAGRELIRQYGRGIFAGRGAGTPVDQLAGELVTLNLLPDGADSSDLVEKLKTLKRPEGLIRRRRRQRAEEKKREKAAGQGKTGENTQTDTGDVPAEVFQLAYHGSVAKFERFDTSFMGTGEGAQVHGWGLYFAQERETADENYRGRLTANKNFAEVNGRTYKYDGFERMWFDVKTRQPMEESEFLALEYLMAYGTAEEAAEALRMENSHRGNNHPAIKAAKKLESGRFEYKQSSGQLYEVDIPDDDVLLDEQKPFKDQPEKVKQALIKLGWKPDYVFNWRYDRFPTAKDQREDGWEIKRVIEGDTSIAPGNYWPSNDVTGKDIYSYLAHRRGWNYRRASLALNRAGIEGITYVGGTDGRCFVIFNDKAVKILKTYYALPENGAGENVNPSDAWNVKDYAHGATSVLEDGRYLVELFRGADLSTLAHETAHVFFLQLQELERRGLADEQTEADLKTLREWTSVFDDDAKLAEEYEKNYAQLYGTTRFKDLWDNQKEEVRERAKQEMLARGWEKYLREGKAPASNLTGLFARFKKWLLRIYRDAAALGVELDDEVRDVFDRILATDDEMDLKAEAANIRAETENLMDRLGLEGAERLRIQSLVEQAKQQAADKLRRVRDAQRREQLRKWAAEAKAEAEGEQVYQARKAVRQTPLDLDDVRADHGDETARQLMRALPGALKKDGADPELAAAGLGYENAAAMLADIIGAPGKTARIKQLINEKQAAWDSNFYAEDYLFEQEQLEEKERLIGEKLAEKIERLTAQKKNRKEKGTDAKTKKAEGKAAWQAEVTGKTLGGKEIIPSAEDYQDYGKLARWRAGREQLRALAAAALNEKPMGEQILPDQYRRQAGRWIQQERRAILRENYSKALECNYKSRINIEMARLSAERRDLALKLQGSSKKFVGMAKADPNARYAVLRLAKNIGLFDVNRQMLALAGDKTSENINAFYKKMQSEGFLADSDINPALYQDQPVTWKGLTWDMFRQYYEAITQIIHVERTSRTIETEQGKRDLQAVADEVAASIYASNTVKDQGALKKRSRLWSALKKYHAAHLKADTILLLLDGDTMGAAWKAISGPIRKATWERADRLKTERDNLRKLFSVYSHKELMQLRHSRYHVQGVTDAVTKEQAICVLLNSGNAGNLDRMLRGMNLDMEQVRAIIDSLDEKDVNFVQNVWDYLETFRKESFDLEESLTGVRPQAVAATPVPTKFGVLKGGYYPIVYDRELSAVPVDPEKVGTQTGGMFPNVDHGSMKARGTMGLGTPLKLSLDVVTRHVSDTVHMLTFRRPVMEVAKLLRNRTINTAIESTAGVEIAKQLNDWLHYLAGERPSTTGWDKVASWARKNAALYSMGFKLSTMLAQTTGLLVTAAEIGPLWTARGIVDMFGGGNPVQAYRTVMELSPMMRNRISSIDRDIFEVTSSLDEGRLSGGAASAVLDPVLRMKNWVEQHAFTPMGWVQMLTADLPTWYGAYAKAMHENGGDIEASAEYADNIVERTQIGGADKDLAAVQRGREIGKLMTMFYSYFSALYNLSARRVTMLNRHRDMASVGRLATLALLTWFLEPVLMGLLLRGGPDEKDPGPEDWLGWGAWEAFKNPWNMLIGVREIASMVDSYVSGYGGRFRMSSALDVFDSYGKFGAQIGRVLEGSGDAKKLATSGAKAVGQSTGIFNAQFVLLLETFWDWLDGSSPDLELGNLLRKKK